MLVGMRDTAEVMRRFNAAFVDHDGVALEGLIGAECVMEAVEPAPEGARYVGRDACLAFWRALADDRSTQFEPEEVTVAGDRATIRWRYRFGPGPLDYVRGVNVMRVRDGLVVEALGYSKTPAVGSAQLASLIGPADA
jgi:ketosteroid isomerase-like protein